MRYQLNEMGIVDIIEASNGRRGLNKLGDPGINHPDIVFCDLHMDEMDGLQFCNAFRHNEALKATGIPIIIITGEGEKLVHDVARQVGAKAVLTKPFATHELQDHLERVVGFQVGQPAL